MCSQINVSQWTIACTSILSSTFLFALDNTVVANIQPAIINDFGLTQDLPWVGVAYALGGISLLPWYMRARPRQ